METYTKTKLRDYQAKAVHDAFEHIKISTEPCLIEAFTAAGKSLIVAELARKIHKFSGKSFMFATIKRTMSTEHRKILSNWKSMLNI